MARAPDPRIEQAKAMYLSGKKLVEIANQLNLPEGTVRRWKCTHKWDGERSGKKSERSHKKGPPKGNKNAVGNNGGPPPQNKNAEKFGFFSKYLPQETVSIIQAMPTDPLDILWDQVQIAYAAIIRAQTIMYVRDQDDSTTTKIGESIGEASFSKKWEVQQAWDKQGSFLQAQARAQKTLEGLIRQYDELLHKRWDLATDEQRARIAQIRAQTARINLEQNSQDDDGVEVVNDAPKEASTDIRDCNTEVPSDLQ